MTTDMWSVGVMTYVLLSGLSPFLGDNNQETFDNITNNHYVFEEEEFAQTTQEAKDFIDQLLVVNQNQRLTAAAAMYHPWMLSTTMSSPGASKERLQVIVARMRWQKCATMVKAATRFQRASSC